MQGPAVRQKVIAASELIGTSRNQQNLKLLKQKIEKKSSPLDDIVIDKMMSISTSSKKIAGSSTCADTGERNYDENRAIKMNPKASDQIKLLKISSTQDIDSDSVKSNLPMLSIPVEQAGSTGTNTSQQRSRHLAIENRANSEKKFPLIIKSDRDGTDSRCGSNNQTHSPPSISRPISPKSPNILNPLIVPIQVPTSPPQLSPDNRSQRMTMPPNKISPNRGSGLVPTPVSARRIEVGLENLGNTCFMNSSLQCLLHIDALVSYFLSESLSSDINPSSPMRGTLAMSFAQLIKDFTSTATGTVVSPVNFQRAVSVHAPHLLDFQQQDCQEFLRFLLDGMSEDLCRYRLDQSSSNQSPTTKTEDAMASPIRHSSIKSLIHQPGSSTATSLESSRSESVAEVAARVRQKLMAMDATAPLDEDEEAGGGVCDVPTDIAMGSDGTPAPAMTGGATGATGDVMEDDPCVASAKSLIERRRDKKLIDDGVALDRLSPLPMKETLVPQPKLQSFSLIRSISLTAGRSRSNAFAKGAVRSSSEGSEWQTNSARTAEMWRKVHEEAAKAWTRYLEKNDSVVTDIFAGQLQSTVECDVCHNRSSCFDPFLDLSVPIPRICELTTTPKGWRKGSNNDATKCTLDECVEKLIGEEVLEGDNMVTCDVCKQKTRSVRRLFVYKFPRVLVVHIKRFRYNAHYREKLSTDVNFPITGFELAPYISPDLKRSSTGEKVPISAVYDLLGVSHHNGSLNGGHYIAHVETTGTNGSASRWMCFNDSRVSVSNPTSVAGPSAYVLFYQLRQDE